MSREISMPVVVIAIALLVVLIGGIWIVRARAHPNEVIGRPASMGNTGTPSDNQ